MAEISIGSPPTASEHQLTPRLLCFFNYNNRADPHGLGPTFSVVATTIFLPPKLIRFIDFRELRKFDLGTLANGGNQNDCWTAP